MKKNSSASALFGDNMIQKREAKQIPISKAILKGRESIFISSTISLRRDNQNSITLTYNLMFYLRTKHIDIQHYYI